MTYHRRHEACFCSECWRSVSRRTGTRGLEANASFCSFIFSCSMSVAGCFGGHRSSGLPPASLPPAAAASSVRCIRTTVRPRRGQFTATTCRNCRHDHHCIAFALPTAVPTHRPPRSADLQANHTVVGSRVLPSVLVISRSPSQSSAMLRNLVAAQVAGVTRSASTLQFVRCPRCPRIFSCTSPRGWHLSICEAGEHDAPSPVLVLIGHELMCSGCSPHGSAAFSRHLALLFSLYA